MVARLTVRFCVGLLLLLFLPVWSASARGDEQRYLFKASRNGKIGFIDSTGNFIIKPQFQSANDFSEGLAAVRVGGTYGFIDQSGNFVIRPQYDYATSFHEDLAVVYDDGKPLFIDRSGNKAFDNYFPFVGAFRNGWAKVATGMHEGYISKTGALIIDTLYQWIHPFVNGFAKVENYAPPVDAVIDRTGKVIVQRDKYDNGSLVSYGYNRTFVWDKDEHISLVNTNGKVIADKAFTGIRGNWPDNKLGFWSAGGLAFARVKDKWGVIDTNGKFMLSPRYDEIDGWGETGDYFFFEKEIGRKSPYNPTYLIGVAAIDGNVLIPPLMEQVDRNGFRHGLLKCYINRRHAYVNRKGEIVWQEDNAREGVPEDMDIDFKDNGEFYVRFKQDAGWHQSDSYTTVGKIDGAMHFPPDQLSVNVHTAEHDIFRKVYNGVKVYVANTTGRKVFFGEDMSHLEMKVQALDSHGNWRDITYVPRSGCGNTYGSVSLDAGEYWTFVVPVYKGSFKTKLRVALKYFPEATADVGFFVEEKEVTIYSNAYNGAINPAQLWRSNGSYYQRDLDPYRAVDW